MSEHWSTPGGCHEDCPACAAEPAIVKILRDARKQLLERGTPSAIVATLEQLDSFASEVMPDGIPRYIRLAEDELNAGQFDEARDSIELALDELSADYEATAEEEQARVDKEFCCVTLCEWPSVTTRGDRHLCAQCAEAYDAGVLAAQTYGEMGLPITKVGDVVQSIARAVVERGNVPHDDVIRFLTAEEFDEDIFWTRFCGPAVDFIEEGAR